MSVEPDDPPGSSVMPRQPGERPERHGVVAAEDEGHSSVSDRLSYECRDPSTRIEDLR